MIDRKVEAIPDISETLRPSRTRDAITYPSFALGGLAFRSGSGRSSDAILAAHRLRKDPESGLHQTNY